MNAEPGSYTDPADGRIYRTVRIGNQVWMAENLCTGSYRNGDPIPNITGDDEWGEREQGAWCHYNNDTSFESTFGRLYNWLAVNDPRGLAPEGWHIPADDEWKALELFLGMESTALKKTGWRGESVGGKLKETGTKRWKSPNAGASDAYGFSALPGGYRDVEGTFYVLGSSGYWWSSSEYQAHFAWYRSLYYTRNMIHRTNSYVGDGFSVRCIRD